MRKVLCTVVLVTFLLNIALSSMEIRASSGAMSAIPSAVVFTSPYRIEGVSGQTVVVDVLVENITDLFAFQVGAVFDPNVVSCLSVTEGGFLSNNGADSILFFPAIINNTKGEITPYGAFLLDTSKSKSGSGRLLYFTFELKKTGYSDIHIRAFMAPDDYANQIPCNIVDFYTIVVGSSEYVVRIVENAQGQLSKDGGYSAHNVTKLTPISPDIYHGQFSFNVTGYTFDDDSFAYFNVTIPKDVMCCTTYEEWLVLLNDVEQATRIVHENSTHTTISLEFTYNDAQPVQTVKIKSVYTYPIISHRIPLDVVFVGYREEAIDMAALESTVVKDYSAPYAEWNFMYHFDVNYFFANQTYRQALALFILENSVIGMDTTSKLNVTALEYQRATGTKMSIFLPQSGRAIDAVAIEDWFATHPYISSSTPHYTFYVLNFTNLDSRDHRLEHWYNLTETDFDANTTRDFWRLEWDNALNPHAGFPYVAFSYRHPLFFIDPSAFNWYLTWARIWWELDPYLAAPKYDYYFEDLDTFQQTHDLRTPEGRTALGYYLGGWLDDILSNSLAPSIWAQPTYSLSLQVLVLNNATEYGYTNDKMRWMLNTSQVKEAVEQIAPWMPIDVSVKFANLSEYPVIDALLRSCIINETNGRTYINGETFFYGLEDLRNQYFDYNRAEMVVNGYVTLLENASMIFGGGEFTGLGGDRQVLLMKSVDRYFRPDGVTPKSGLTAYMTHELGHNLGFPHTFTEYTCQYAGDFAFDVMGYYPYAFYFSKLKTDVYRRAYMDFSVADLQNALITDHELYSSQSHSILIDKLFNEIDNRINVASSLFDELKYLNALHKVFEAQRIEAYLRELLTNIIYIGDVNHDGTVNMTDLARIRGAWGSRIDKSNYDFFADLDHDGFIDIKDVSVIGANWLKTGKVKAGFFRWATGNRTTTFDYIANVYPDWWWTEKNMTYGFWNWGNESLRCSLRIKDITDLDNINYIDFRIYNATTEILSIQWEAGDPIPNDWTSFIVAAQSKYSIQLYVEYTSYAPTWFSRITFETRVDAP